MFNILVIKTGEPQNIALKIEALVGENGSIVIVSSIPRLGSTDLHPVETGRDNNNKK